MQIVRKFSMPDPLLQKAHDSQTDLSSFPVCQASFGRTTPIQPPPNSFRIEPVSCTRNPTTSSVSNSMVETLLQIAARREYAPSLRKLPGMTHTERKKPRG